MSHYFIDDKELKSETFEYQLEILGHKISLFTDNGVFSKQHLDFGSKLLIEEFKNPDIKGLLLDLGCGIGVIGIALAKSYKRDLMMLDVNPRAVSLANKNLEKNDVIGITKENNILENIKEEFAVIVTNPPIRAGKKIVHEFFKQSYEHLVINGQLWVVIRKQQGAESAIKVIKELFKNCEIVKKKKGFHVLKATKWLETID